MSRHMSGIKGNRLFSFIIALLMVLLLPLVIAGVITIKQVEDAYDDMASDRLRDLSSAMVAKVEGAVQERIGILSTLALVPVLDHPLGDLSVLQERMRMLPAFKDSRGAVFASDGTLLMTMTIPFGQPLPPSSELVRTAIHQTVVERRPYIGPMRRSVAGENILPIHVPVIRNGEVVAVVCTTITQEELNLFLGGREFFGGFLAIIEPFGRYAAGSPINNATRADLSVDVFYSLVAEALSNETNTVVSNRLSPDGQQMVLSFMELPSARNWFIVAGASRQELAAPVERSFKIFLIAAGVACLISAGGAGIILHAITRMTKIVQQAAELANGDPFPRTGVTEFDAMLGRLSNMADRLDIMVQSTGIGLWECDIKTGQAIASAAVFDMIGLPFNERGKLTTDFWLNQVVHPDDRLIWLTGREKALVQDMIQIGYRIIRQDTGETRHLDVISRYFGPMTHVNARFPLWLMSPSARARKNGRCCSPARSIIARRISCRLSRASLVSLRKPISQPTRLL